MPVTAQHPAPSNRLGLDGLEFVEFTTAQPLILQVMLSARDVVGHPDGEPAAIATVRASGLRVTGFQVLRDFEGLSGHLHQYKVDVAKSMLQMCQALGAPVLLVCSSTSTHATHEPDALAADLRKLAMLAVPLGIRVAYEALSWGRHTHRLEQAWSLVERARHANLGLCVDSFHALANEGAVDALDAIDAGRVFLVQLSDFLWQRIQSREERMETARHLRVFPGEGVHNDLVAELIRRLDRRGYVGDYSFEVFNDDYTQMPLASVCERAVRSVTWIAERVAHDSLAVLREPRPGAPPRRTHVPWRD